MRRLGAVLTATAAALLPAIGVTPGAHATGMPGLGRPAAAPSVLPAQSTPSPLQVALTAVSSPVAVGDDPVTLTVRVSSQSSTPLTSVVVEVREDARDVTTREDVAAWASTSGPASGAVLGTTRLPKPLAAGTAVEAKVTVRRVGAGRAETFGAIPISVTVISGQESVSQHTFLGYERIKRYEPLQLSINLPLLRGTQTGLTAADVAERELAWQQFAAPEGRPGRIIAGAGSSPVGWIVDAALTRPAQVLPGTIADNPDTYAASAAEVAARTELAQRIRSAVKDRPTIVLPTGDPDVLAVGSGPEANLTIDQVRATRADSGGIASMPSATTIAWPAFGTWPKGADQTLRKAYDGQLTAALVDNAFLDRTTTSGVATGQTAAGLPLVVYDGGLSGLFAKLSSKEAGVAAAQRLIAETAGIVLDRPGTVRQVAIVAPRTFDPDPTALRTVLSTAAAVPWLTTTRLDAVLATSAREGATVGPSSTPPKVKGLGWKTSTLRGALADVRTVGALGEVRTDGDAYVAPIRQASWLLTSTGWRTSATPWKDFAAQIGARAEDTERVYVSPQQITFLADSGRVRLVVVNDLDAPVENLRLRVQPESLRIRIAQPELILSIGANSRATATFDVTALAAGPVRMVTTILTPDGAVIHDETAVTFQVTPTGAWLYWVIGIGAGAMLVGGIVAAIRRGPKPAVPGINVPLEEPR